MQHGLRLNLYKTEIFTTDLNETTKALSLAVTCPQLNDLKIKIYQYR